MRTLRLVAVTALLVGTGVVVVGCTGPRTSTSGRADFTRVPLRYGPTWLPDGYVERERNLVSPDRDRARLGREFRLANRVWWAGSVDPGKGGGFLRIDVDSDPFAKNWCKGGRSIDIDGQPAVFDRQPDKGCVYRSVGADTRVHVYVAGAGVDPDDALRVAWNVRPVDDDFAVPFRLPRRDFLYGDSADTWVNIGITGTSPTDWTATTQMGPQTKSNPRGLVITFGTTTPAPPGGTKGPTGRHVSTGNSTFLVADVGPRLLLTVELWQNNGGVLPSLQTLEKVVDRVDVGTAETAWIGTR